jgi:DNA-damage-inducible protein D
MKRPMIPKLHAKFDKLVHRERETGTEFWLARELQPLLGYARWANFARLIHEAQRNCQAAGCEPEHHFLEVTRIELPHLGTQRKESPNCDAEREDTRRQDAEREIEDFALTRYACYLLAQKADASKDPVAFAQSYFAVPSRQLELVERRLADAERLDAREKLSRSEKILSGLIYEHVVSVTGFSRIHIKGDQALFGGITTRQMKRRLRVPKGRALADFLPTITIKAKDFANELTNASIKRDYLHTEAQITREHVKNNRDVRKLMRRRKIDAEKLPAAEDVKKIERRFTAEDKLMPEHAKRLQRPIGNHEQQLAFC